MLAGGCDAIGVAEGGGDADLATGFPKAGLLNLAVTSQTLAPGETAIRSTDRGDAWSEPNPFGRRLPGRGP